MAETYRVGVIGRTGHGDYGHGVDEVWKEFPNTPIVAVADDNKMGLAAAATRLQVDRTYLDYRKMLDEVKPDIVAICPRWLDKHHEMAMEAARRGMHIFMEKPFCPTLAEADDIIATCERTHSRLAIAHPTRYSPRLQSARQLIEDGKIGKVLEYRGRGKEDQRGGGEDLWVLGTHVMDMIRALAGHPEWCFALVTQEGEPVTAKHVVQGNEGIGRLAGDAIRASYGLANGATAYFSSYRGAAGRPSRYALQIYGSRGVIEILEGTMPEVRYLGDPGWSPGRSGAKWQPVTTGGIDQPEPLTDPIFNSRHGLAVRDLLEAIEQQREPACGMYEARGATEMIVAVFESHRQRRPVPLPLVNRQDPLAMLG
ncbi:MAG: Gfo/Idh/MocA family oxidoreductase [Pirellulales bacterium]